jgi:hypothetical protein
VCRYGTGLAIDGSGGVMGPPGRVGSPAIGVGGLNGNGGAHGSGGGIVGAPGGVSVMGPGGGALQVESS